MAKLYLTYDAAKPLSTLAVWSRKGDASVAAKQNGHVFKEHEVEMKREGVASWISNELLAWLADPELHIAGEFSDVPNACAPDPASSDNSDLSASPDKPEPGDGDDVEEQTIVVSGPPADDDGASDLEAMEPAGGRDDPVPPTTADEELAGRGVSAAERAQQSLDQQGAGERPPEAQEAPGPEEQEDDPTAGLEDIL